MISCCGVQVSDKKNSFRRNRNIQRKHRLTQMHIQPETGSRKSLSNSKNRQMFEKLNLGYQEKNVQSGRNRLRSKSRTHRHSNINSNSRGVRRTRQQRNTVGGFFGCTNAQKVDSIHYRLKSKNNPLLNHYSATTKKKSEEQNVYSPQLQSTSNNVESLQNELSNPLDKRSPEMEARSDNEHLAYRKMMLARLNKVNLTEEEYEDYIRYTKEAITTILPDQKLRSLLIVINKADCILNYKFTPAEYEYLEKKYQLQSVKKRLIWSDPACASLWYHLDVEEIKKEKREPSRPNSQPNRQNSATRNLQPNFDQIKISNKNTATKIPNTTSETSFQSPNIFNLSGVTPTESPTPPSKNIFQSPSDRITSQDILNSFSKPGQKIAYAFGMRSSTKDRVERTTSAARKPTVVVETKIVTNQPQNMFQKNNRANNMQTGNLNPQTKANFISKPGSKPVPRTSVRPPQKAINNILDLSNVEFKTKKSSTLKFNPRSTTSQAPVTKKEPISRREMNTSTIQGSKPSRTQSLAPISTQISIHKPKIPQDKPNEKRRVISRRILQTVYPQQRSSSLGGYVPLRSQQLKLPNNPNPNTVSTKNALKTDSRGSFINLGNFTGQTKLRKSGIRYSVSKFSERDLTPKTYTPNIKVYRANVLRESKEGSIKRSMIHGTPHFNMIDSNIRRSASQQQRHTRSSSIRISSKAIFQNQNKGNKPQQVSIAQKQLTRPNISPLNSPELPRGTTNTPAVSHQQSPYQLNIASPHTSPNLEHHSRAYADSQLLQNRAYYGTQSPLSRGAMKQGVSKTASVRQNLLTKVENGAKISIGSEIEIKNSAIPEVVSTNKKLTSVPYTLSKENNSRRNTFETTLVSPQTRNSSQMKYRSPQSNRSTLTGNKDKQPRATLTGSKGIQQRNIVQNLNQSTFQEQKPPEVNVHNSQGKIMENKMVSVSNQIESTMIQRDSVSSIKIKNIPLEKKQNLSQIAQKEEENNLISRTSSQLSKNEFRVVETHFIGENIKTKFRKPFKEVHTAKKSTENNSDGKSGPVQLKKSVFDARNIQNDSQRATESNRSSQISSQMNNNLASLNQSKISVQSQQSKVGHRFTNQRERNQAYNTSHTQPKKNRLRDVLLSPRMPLLNEESEDKENYSNLANIHPLQQSSSDIDFVLNSQMELKAKNLNMELPIKQQEKAKKKGSDKLSSQYIKLRSSSKYNKEPERPTRKRSNRKRGVIKAHTLRFGVNGSFGRRNFR